MKLKGIFGKGSGKLGSSVFAISGGEQIVREYNPRVANPNTDAQVAQRAKMKLMSQLAAALAPGLGFKKMGLVSARNQFVAKNIGLCAYANDEATCDLDGLKLTSGARPFVGLNIAIGENNKIVISNGTPIDDDVKKAIIVVTKSGNEDKLVLVDVKVVDVDNTHNISVNIDDNGQENLLVYAYGWIATSSSNSVAYGNYEANTADQTAKLDVLITSLLNGGTFTETSFGLFEA